MNSLTVANVEASDNLLRVHFKCSGELRKFFKKNVFVAKYDTSIEDVPESFLVIPFLGTVCPIAWAGGADVYVKTVDENFLHALGVVKKTFQKFYPEVGFGGSIHADNIVTPDVGVRSKSMMLFSGGADSLTTYIRHRTENLFWYVSMVQTLSLLIMKHGTQLWKLHKSLLTRQDPNLELYKLTFDLYSMS